MKALFSLGMVLYSLNSFSSGPSAVYSFCSSPINAESSDFVQDLKGDLYLFDCPGRAVDLPVAGESNFIEFETYDDCMKVKRAILEATNERPVEIEVVSQQVIRVTTSAGGSETN